MKTYIFDGGNASLQIDRNSMLINIGTSQSLVGRKEAMQICRLIAEAMIGDLPEYVECEVLEETVVTEKR